MNWLFYVQLSRFLNDLSQLLHVDTEMLSVDTAAAMDALLNHIGRLIRNESTSLADCRTHIHGLQRKLKSTKELLDGRVSTFYYAAAAAAGDDDDDSYNSSSFSAAVLS